MKEDKMNLCQKEFLLLVQFIAGSNSKVTVPEGYDKYDGSQGWKKLWLVDMAMGKGANLIVPSILSVKKYNFLRKLFENCSNLFPMNDLPDLKHIRETFSEKPDRI